MKNCIFFRNKCEKRKVSNIWFFIFFRYLHRLNWIPVHASAGDTNVFSWISSRLTFTRFRSRQRWLNLGVYFNFLFNPKKKEFWKVSKSKASQKPSKNIVQLVKIVKTLPKFCQKKILLKICQASLHWVHEVPKVHEVIWDLYELTFIKMAYL